MSIIIRTLTFARQSRIVMVFADVTINHFSLLFDFFDFRERDGETERVKRGRQKGRDGEDGEMLNRVARTK